MCCNQQKSIEWKFMIYEGVTRGFNDASHFIFLFPRLLGVS